MSRTIKFATLENKEIEVTIEDAKLIALQSVLVRKILSGELQSEVYAVQKGGEAINLALKYCKKFGAIKDSCSQHPESFEIKCKEAQAWVNEFISHITKDGLGMVHELLAVSKYLEAFRLYDLTCQCIFDYLTFKDCGKFREAFAFQFLFQPYFSNKEIHNIEQVLEGLELPTLEEIHADFEDKIPFTSDELKLAESENKSVRVGGNLEYKTNKRWIEELLIKLEYLVRRLSSFWNLSIWMEDAFSKCRDESCAYFEKFLNNQSNHDIRTVYLELSHSAATFHSDIMDYLLHGSGIENPCTNYENIDLIRDEMNKIEIKLAGDADAQKKKAEEFTKVYLTKWQAYHSNEEDKIFPHLTCFLENRYHEIHCVLCSLRGWMSPLEVQSKFSKSNICEKPKFEHMKDQNEDQSEDLVSQKFIAEQIRADVVSSLMKLQYLAASTARQFYPSYAIFCKLQMEMRKPPHANLLLKDEKILTFICKEKFYLYMRASELGTISFAENKEEFDRIMEETDQKFHGRSSDIEEAKKKYFLYYKKFHYAMVDETKRQMNLRLDVEEGRRKRKRTTS